MRRLSSLAGPIQSYTEREVNLIIADFHDDFATLRRDLVDEHLMTRENGQFRRIV